jgi:excisionase family DNA binding protein
MRENQNKENRKTYSLWPEAGEMLGLAKNATYNAAHRGEIPTIKIGGRILVPKAAFDRMLEATK